MDIDMKWMIISIVSIAILFVTLFAPFLSYKTDNGILLHYEKVYYDGSWKNADITAANESITTGDYHDWEEGKFSLASPILLLLGISIMIIGSIALIFDVNVKWGILFRGVTLLGAILGFTGIMIYTPFAIYVTHITYITLSVTSAFALVALAPFAIAFYVGFSLFSKIIRNRERKLEIKST